MQTKNNTLKDPYTLQDCASWCSLLVYTKNKKTGNRLYHNTALRMIFLPHKLCMYIIKYIYTADIYTPMTLGNRDNKTFLYNAKLIVVIAISFCIWWTAIWSQVEAKSGMTSAEAIAYICRNYTALSKQAKTNVRKQQLAAIYAKKCSVSQPVKKELNLNGTVVATGSRLAPYFIPQVASVWRGKKNNKNGVQLTENLHFASEKKDMSVRLPAGLTIREAQDKVVNLSTFALQLLTPTEKKAAGALYGVWSEQFRFGVSWQHLLFSQPVQIQMATTLPDGKIIDVLVQHEGDDQVGKQWLTANPNAVCLADGSVSKSDQLFTTVVQNGVVTFYTCGASLFTMNPAGGLAWSQDLKILIGDYAQVQVYYNNLAQIYGGNPPTNGAGGPSAWPRLNIGTRSVGNGWTAWTTASTTGQQAGNLYTAKSTMTYVSGSLTYTAVIDWSYTAPDKYFTWTYTIAVPAGNTQNIKFYYGMDSFVAGGDANDVGYFSTGNGITVGIYDNVANILSAQRYMAGRARSWYEAGPYGNISARISSNVNFNNTIAGTAGDYGYGINWDFGTAPGVYTSTTQWRLVPYVTVNKPDMVPGVWQPVPTLAAWTTSYIPVSTTNVGLTGATGQQLIRFTIASWVNGPTTWFTSSGWTCGAVVLPARTVTCTKTTIIAPLAFDGVSIPVVPTTWVQWQTLRFTWYVHNSGEADFTNNTWYISLQVAVKLPITSLSLSGNSLNEEQATWILIGTLSTVDPNTGAVQTYTLDTTCPFTGDNTKFALSGNQLRSNHVFNYPVQSWANVCIRTTNNFGVVKTGSFAITIVSIWTISVSAPSSLSRSSISTSLSPQALSQTFSGSTGDRFVVSDTKWFNSGYMSTLQMSGNLVATVWGYTIGSGRVWLMWTPTVSLVSWFANALVQPTTWWASPFRALSGIQNLIWRNPWANAGVKWSYGVYLPLQINIPAAQPAWMYVWTLVFTVIEN